MNLSTKPVVVMASGPSLTDDDIALVERAGVYSIAVNSTWEKARFCDILYAGDMAWWKHNHDAIDIDAARWTCSRSVGNRYGARFRASQFKPGYNSGANAVELAAHLGAAVILMVGFDCSIKQGLHHHGSHTKTGNPTDKRCHQWKKHFRQLARRCRDITVLNCSRYTEVDCFEQVGLAEALTRHGALCVAL